MRINRETLLKIAQETVAQRAHANRDLVAAYLCGSLLEEDYLLGGTADIDLVFIHTDEITAEREIIRLTDEVHLDIAHHAFNDYQQARRLRVHPWLEPTINGCKALHDPQHFLDFTQASVRGQFDRADHVLERANFWVGEARRTWINLLSAQAAEEAGTVLEYLRAVGCAANAVAGLSGPPLTERRFLVEFPGRAERIGRPGLAAGLLGLLGAARLRPEALEVWLESWRSAFHAVPGVPAPHRLHPHRRDYYQKWFESLMESDRPQLALWPLLNTWTLAVSLLPPASQECAAWHQCLDELELLGEVFGERLEALDAYLDLVEETVEQWGLENGA
jgi:hypothetical protein